MFKNTVVASIEFVRFCFQSNQDTLTSEACSVYTVTYTFVLVVDRDDVNRVFEKQTRQGKEEVQEEKGFFRQHKQQGREI